MLGIEKKTTSIMLITPGKDIGPMIKTTPHLVAKSTQEAKKKKA